jgi:CMP-2-keto-3-deoxyoctulosonic acid synthetase
MGRGFGFRAAAPAPLTREEQLEALRAQVAGLELQFKALTEQIGKLESE